MDFSNLRWSDWLAGGGGVLLAVAVFLPAFTVSDNPNAMIAGKHADASIMEASSLIGILLLLAAIAPLVLIYIIARGHELSWPRGEMTAVIGLVATTLIFYRGIIDRPGEPNAQISLGIGWLLALIGALAMTIGGAIRSSEVERKRKPPGVL
jgi:drug/metabolite transporter (DMT)-like permease